MALERTVYQQDLWNAWVEKTAAAATPGAQSFIAFAEKRGVKVFFVTNRAVSEQAATLEEPDGTGHCGVRRNDSQPGRKRVDVRQNGPASRDCQVACACCFSWATT